MMREAAAAFLLRRRDFAAIARDSTATPKALAIVVAVALVHGFAGAIRASANRNELLVGPLFGIFGELVFWSTAGVSAAACAAGFFRSSASIGAYYRAIALAAVPGTLIAVAAVVGLAAPGSERVVLLFVALYRVAALTLAVEAAAEVTVGRAVIVSAIVLLVGLSAVVAVTATLDAAVKL